MSLSRFILDCVPDFIALYQNYVKINLRNIAVHLQEEAK